MRSEAGEGFVTPPFLTEERVALARPGLAAEFRGRLHDAPLIHDEHPDDRGRQLASAVDGDNAGAVFRNAAARLDTARDELCHLDGEIGDGDHGTSMANGFAAIALKFRSGQDAPAEPSVLMREAASVFLADVGATVGPLYATAILDAARVFDDGPVPLERAPAVLGAMARGIARRGKAGPGDKTMLDAWLPAVHAAERARGRGWRIPPRRAPSTIPRTRRG